MAKRNPAEHLDFYQHQSIEALILQQNVLPVDGSILDSMRTLAASLWPTEAVVEEFTGYIQTLRHSQKV